MGLVKEFITNVAHPSALLKVPHTLQDITFFQAWCLPPIIGIATYLLICGGEFLIFFCIFRHKFFPNYKPDWRTIKKEISLSVFSAVVQALWVAAIFRLNVSGYGKIYLNIEDRGWGYFIASTIGLLAWAETTLYWVHRWLHSPFWFKHIHKYHHEFVDTTPWTSYAFHPMDAFLQSISFHLVPFFFPVNVWVYFGCLEIMSLWSFNIHDRICIAKDGLIMGAGYHTIHHERNDFNFGQFFTLWDKWCGTLREPCPDKMKAKIG
mmetsp:Transcript_9780/g.16042  ORF Transcript_9780/g.16042 Transcript_9780/m.16042 type:complete len:264 (-) Transcript_9780:375-1166(-)|eukprot:CAMPEP_0184655926 /NCGR_PEP_ID=MMETSP0308-20130426/14950_1 /TAXON_ID=38269 /ORGANISM="Gloeochaete witrockiana, Strain SAG 46.84" /LENGTH=263 /DNA_ID=CAMNT_0027092749 /DNA_START=167 /DNA_END=958 /DNA_ORIENTATION=+